MVFLVVNDSSIPHEVLIQSLHEIGITQVVDFTNGLRNYQSNLALSRTYGLDYTCAFGLK